MQGQPRDPWEEGVTLTGLAAVSKSGGDPDKIGSKHPYAGNTLYTCWSIAQAITAGVVVSGWEPVSPPAPPRQRDAPDAASRRQAAGRLSSGFIRLGWRRNRVE